jgi:type IV secretion system protein VirB4
LPTHNVTFQYNTIQVEGETGTHYGAILSVKEYQEITVEQIDRFLQLPVQFMVTESFDFVPKDMAVKEVKDQKYIYEVSGSKKMYKLSGIQQMVEAEGEPCDFGEHQIIITLLDDKVKDMQKSLKVVVETLRDLGVVFVREDLFMEDCYWSCMPGNFDFIRRQSFIPTSRIAGYASLYNFPAGKREGNLWGDAVTVFRTADDTPYFFNFHFGDNGHTAIIGPYGAGKTVLLNFLVSEAQKYDAKTVYFEKERGSEAFIRAAGGKYKQVTNEIDKGQLSFNPLILKDTLENREFLKQWFEYLIQFNDNNSIENISDIKAREVTKEDVIKIDEAVKYIFKMPQEDRMLSNIIPKIWKEGEETYEIMKNWFGTGKYAKYFDSPIDNSEINSSNFIAFDISKIVKLKTVTIPMISYLLHALEQSLDGFDPAIIVLDEAWEFIDNPAFQPRLKKWLRKMADKNAIVIFASESVEKIENSTVTNKLFEVVQTQIFLPNKLAGESYEEIFKLSKEEYEIVKNLNKDDRKFLLRHGPDSIVAKLNLEGMDRELAVLSANDERLKKMEDAISEKGDKPENWLPKYFELLNI